MGVGVIRRNWSAVVALALGLSAGASSVAHAATTLSIVQNPGGDLQSMQQAIGVEDPQVITFQWSTDQAAAAGGTWKVTTGTGAKLKTVATGDTGAAPKVGNAAQFTIPTNAQINGPGGFLQSQPIPAQIVYSITVQPYDKLHKLIGTASPAVKVTQAVKAPPTNPFKNTSANYPDITLVHYVEQIGGVPQTQLHYAKATLTLRFTNNSNKATDRAAISAFDDNGLMRAEAGVTVETLKHKGDHVEKTINLTAILPPPASQLPEDQQYSQWQQKYDADCGVDLRVDLDWGGKPAETPLNEHQQVNHIYQGYGGSQSWDEGKPLSADRLCDDANCVSLTKVAQSICKQLRGKVVGYAFYIGNKAVHKTGAYGLAKTAADPPEAAFTPHTKMQIASTSKVLTGLATVRMMKDLQTGATIDNTIFNTLPSDWRSKLPAGHLVRSITFRELVSQKSGVQQYYASSSGQDYDSLEQFFTQPIANPNAAPQCGSTVNPIISNKQPCYTDTNFGLMRVLLARANGLNSTDPLALGQRYVKIVQDNVLKPVGVNASCAPPANGDVAFPYTLDASVPGWDWSDLTKVCGDWGWYLSVDDYGPVLDSLNAGDGKILTDCQFNDVEVNAKLGPNPSMNIPADHGIGFDCRSAGECGLPGGYRWLEKNGADGWDFTDGSGHRRAGTQTTSVAIFGGKNGCGSTKPTPGVVGVLFINSPILNSSAGADTILWQAFLAGVGPK